MNKKSHAKRSVPAAAAIMTAGLLCFLLVLYIKYDRARTLQRALEGIDGDPIEFSAGSGFYEDGFRLALTADARIPADGGIEIRYTVDGDEPGDGSLLYDPGTGIDLQALAEAAEIAETDSEAGEGQDAGADSADSDAAPTIEEAKAAWELEKWLLHSDAGVYPVRTDDGICVIPIRACLLQGEDRSRVVTRTYVIGENVDRRYTGMLSAEEAVSTMPADSENAEAEMETGSGTGIYVVSVVTDTANLFDYDTGIMVKGRHYEEDVANGIREDRAGNFFQTGEEWIKDGHVTLFAPDGEVLLEEDAGLTISGYSSRTLTTRSFRAEASAAHGTSDDYFHLEIFSDDFPARVGGEIQYGAWQAPASRATEAETCFGEEPVSSAGEQTFVPDKNGVKTPFIEEEPVSSAGEQTFVPDKNSVKTPFIEETTQLSTANRPDRSIDLFKKIKFRSHGIPDYHIRSVRNQYAKVLTDECGFPGLVENRLAVMFLNGEFYTVCDIAPSTTKDYLARLFGLHVADAVEKFEGSDYDVYTRAKIVKLLEADLTQEANRAALEQAVDMDNYLFYMALEVLFNNADWPFNNVTMWRYLGEEDPSNPYSDGRFRFIIDDMDQILSNGLHGDPAQWSTELIDYLMRDQGHTFHHVMACEKYRDTFLTYVDDLLKTAFAPGRACALLDELYDAMKNEYILDYGEEFWAEMEKTREVTKQNVREKEALYRENIEKYMGLADRVPVTIEAAEGVTVAWNNMTVSQGINEAGSAGAGGSADDAGNNSPAGSAAGASLGGTWVNAYYSGTSIPMTARTAEGYRLAGWEVNGELCSEEASFTLEIGEEAVTLRAVAVRSDDDAAR